jgi:hypothetical protein
VKGITESAPAALLTGHPLLAGKRFAAHPLVEGLNFAAAETVLGRSTGAALRASGRKAGSTVRPSLALTDQPGSRIVHHRSYSKDSIRKAAQVANDRRRAKAGYVDERGVPVLKSRTHQFPVRSERERLLDARTDYTASRVNSGNRAAREKAARDIRAASPTVRKIRNRVDREIVPIALEGTVRGPAHVLSDLQAHRARLVTTLQQADLELKTLKAKGVAEAGDLPPQDGDGGGGRARQDDRPVHRVEARRRAGRGDPEGARRDRPAPERERPRDGEGAPRQHPPAPAVPAVPVRAGAHGREVHGGRQRAGGAAAP